MTPTAPCPVPRVRRLRCGPPYLRCTRPRPAPVAPPTAVPDDPADREAVAACLLLALEVLRGRRGPMTLQQRFTPDALRYWRAEAERRQVTGPVRIRRIRACRPSEDVAELGVACEFGDRVHALAARFERRADGWWCVSIRLG